MCGKLKVCFESNYGKLAVLATLLILWIAAIVLVSTKWQKDPFTLEIAPRPTDGSTIRVKLSNNESVAVISEDIEGFLEPYVNLKDNCKLGNGTCGPDLKDFYPCIKDNYEFGYKKGTPCVFLKLSLNGNFTPQFYNETNIPEEMPERLKDVIKSNSRNGEKNSEIVWISCGGFHDDDNHDMGPIAYLPHWNFPGFRLSCPSKAGCADPILAIYFRRPKTKTTIEIECKIWAANIRDSVNFKLLVE